MSSPTTHCQLNGCCLPGVTGKNYVSLHGDLRVCESIHSGAPTIGNVFDGYDVEVIRSHYVGRYTRESLPRCSRCWAARLCDICYVDSIGDCGGFDLDVKNRACEAKQEELRVALEGLLFLIDDDPGRVSYLNEFEFNSRVREYDGKHRPGFAL